MVTILRILLATSPLSTIIICGCRKSHIYSRLQCQPYQKLLQWKHRCRATYWHGNSRSFSPSWCWFNSAWQAEECTTRSGIGLIGNVISNGGHWPCRWWESQVYEKVGEREGTKEMLFRKRRIFSICWECMIKAWSGRVRSKVDTSWIYTRQRV